MSITDPAPRLRPGLFPGQPQFDVVGGDFSGQQVISSGATSGAQDYNAFPNLVAMGDGVVWCPFFSAADHQGTKSKIVGRKSTDNGKPGTWEPEVDLVTVAGATTTTGLVPGSARLSDGRFAISVEICTFSGGNHVHQADGVWVYFFTVDEDMDLVFDEAIHLNDGYATYSLTASPIVELDDGAGPALPGGGNMGTLIQPLYGINGSVNAGNQYPSIMKSTDGGATWGTMIPIAQDPAADLGETWIGRCKDGLGPRGTGSLLALVRDNTNSVMKRYRSVNDGTTWVQLSGTNPNARAIPSGLVLADDSILAVTRRGPLSADGAPLLYRSRDHGQTWLGPVIPDSGPWTYSDYGTMIEVRPGLVLLALGLKDTFDATTAACVVRYIMTGPGLTLDGKFVLRGLAIRDNDGIQVIASGVGKRSITIDDRQVAVPMPAPVPRTTTGDASVASPYELCAPTAGTTITRTLPASRNSKGIEFVISNIGAGIVLVNGIGSTTINGSANPVTLYPGQTGRFRSDEIQGVSNYNRTTGRGDNPPACRVYHSVAQTVPNSPGVLALAFDSERYDPDGMHSPANPTRLTAVQHGVHRVICNAETVSNATGTRTLDVRMNGETTAIGRDSKMAASSGNTRLLVDTEYEFQIGDYAELVVIQSSGGNLDVAANPKFSPEASMTFIRPL